MPSVLVNEMPRSDEFKVRNATSRVARLRYATRDYLLHMLFFVFTPLFLPSLCARDGFVDAPPACREKAEIRRKVWGQIWSGIDLKPFFQNFSYFRSFNPVEQLSTGTRNMEILLESNDIDA